MKNKLTKNQFIILIVTFIFFLFSLFIFKPQISTDAQTENYDGIAPIVDAAGTPRKYALKPNTEYKVIVYDSSPEDRRVVDEGIRKWNAQTTTSCSGISFKQAVSL